ncbi:MAG: M23 family metallopeptidase [Actinomycetota bacterium]|nr:M23 family metallopeptidase [Actinomycetota bacterium]
MWHRAWRATVLVAAALSACSDDAPVSLPTTAAEATTSAPTMVAAPTTTAAPTVPPTTVPPEPNRVFPVQDAAHSSFADEHHDYPAADIFTAGGCGSPLVAPVDGVVLELSRVDVWATGGGPETRGGLYLAILGNDGVRYYMAHFSAIEAALAPGVAVTAGQVVGAMGRTGRAGACHLHFALSPVCSNPDWWVRRGAIWPQAYLRDWQQGVPTSPVAEVTAWSAANPTVCTTPAAD